MIRKRKESTPHYRQVYEELRKQILEGSYPVGSFLPSENELCLTYGFSRPTIRLALGKLETDGFLSRIKGKGSLVSRIPGTPGIIFIAGGSLDTGEKLLKSRLINKPAVIDWPDPFFFSLSATEKQAEAICMERIRLYRGDPVVYDTSFLANIRVPRFTTRSFESKSLFEILRKSYNLEIKGGEQKIKAISADENCSELLAISPGTPVIQLLRRFNTNRNGISIYSSLLCRTDHHFVSQLF
ncbi:MAG: GntR family transcriptional regulator [Bacteroidota bacterium]